MATFKAKYSPTQTFSFKDSTHHFSNGFYKTDDKDVIAFLQKNHGCDEVAGKQSAPVPPPIPPVPPITAPGPQAPVAPAPADPAGGEGDGK